MLRAAFTSRSWIVPHGHVHSLMPSGIVSWSAPHAEHTLDEGNQRSITTNSRPYHRHL